MTLFRMFDASCPPAEPYPGCAAVAGYIGGRTPNVWTAGEWNLASDGGRLRQLPIWVAQLRPADPTPEGQARLAAAAAIKLGWGQYMHDRRAIVLDLETAIVPMFVDEFAETLHNLGFSCWPYGSADFIFVDPTEDGYWVAAYPGPGPNLNFPGERVMAHQFAADVPFGGTVVDLSVVSAAGLAHLGIGLRKG